MQGDGIGARLANDNQIGLIVQANSGLPYNIRSNRDLNLDGIPDADRPNGIARNSGKLGLCHCGHAVLTLRAAHPPAEGRGQRTATVTALVLNVCLASIVSTNMDKVPTGRVAHPNSNENGNAREPCGGS